MNRPVIGLNLVYLHPGRLGGTATYARELLKQFADMPHDFDFVLFLNRDSLEEFHFPSPRFRSVVLPVKSGSPAKRHLLEQSLLPFLVEKYGVGLLHSMGFVCPILAPTVHVVTIHDMIYRQRPDRLPAAKRLFWQIFVPASVRRAAGVIAVSENARQDVLRYLSIPPGKVVAIHEGISCVARPSVKRVECVKRCFGLAEPYVLAVGCGVHKRIDILIAAVKKLPKMHLVITGVPESGVAPSDPDPRVKYLGFVSYEDLNALYAGARAYVTASEMEGFGLTVLEAMNAETPVISSEAGALPEVCGDAACMVHSMDSDDYAREIARVCFDDEVRRELIKRGRKRVANFSWRVAAEKHLRLYADLTGAALSSGGIS